MLSFFPRGVLGEILNLIESVSEGFPTLSFTIIKADFLFFFILKIVYCVYSLESPR